MSAQTVGISQQRDAVDAKQDGTVQENAKLLIIGEHLTDMNVLQEQRKRMMLNMMLCKVY
jgi:hypothetical protein